MLADHPREKSASPQPGPQSDPLPSPPNAHCPTSRPTSVASTHSVPAPPALPYSIRDHKRNVSLIWTLLALESAVIPITLFYSLTYASSLKPTYVFDIITSLFGFISGLEWVYRSWALWRKEELRPLGQNNRWAFDFFHITYTIGYGIGLIELIGGSSTSQPIVRLCAMPTPSFILFVGLELLLFSVCRLLNLHVPFRVSSQLKGTTMRPATYMIIEDVMSVDTGLGRRYRTALDERYQASPMFRKLLAQMDLFWGIPAVCIGAAVIAVVLIWSVPQPVAYGLGWGIPPVWAGTWAFITTKWVQRTLRKEKELWSKEGRV